MLQRSAKHLTDQQTDMVICSAVQLAWLKIPIGHLMMNTHVCMYTTCERELYSGESDTVVRHNHLEIKVYCRLFFTVGVN